MALVLADRVKETTSSTGTTAITLAGAATGYQTFSSAVGDANTTYYTIADQTGANWEVGIGTYTTSGNTLSRDTVLASSNAGNLVAFTAGVKDVFISYPAERALYAGGPLGTPSSGTLTNATGYTYANLSGTVPTWNQNTTGTATNVTGLVAVANGGTGTATPALVAGSNVTITGTWPNQTIAASGAGTVTTVSVVSANGFTGTVANATTTPAITLTTSITGLLKGNGTAISAATSGTDYSAGTSALTTGILKSTTSTGALTIAVAADFPTLNQNTTGTATTATNLASGSAGTIPYQTASGTTAMLAVGTSGQVLTSNGAAAPTWATASGGGGTKTISNKTAAYTIVSGDLGKIINCTSGTFTVSLTAAATLGAGFNCTIWNTGTGAITIDPAGAETIDGYTTWILRSREGLAVVCDGTNWLTDDKKPMIGYAENNITDARPIASGGASISIGAASTASGNYSLALGALTTASGANAVAIGNTTTTAGANYSTAIGLNSTPTGSVTATGAGAMALGGSYASGTDSFAAGVANNTSSYGATGTNSIAIGQTALASSSNTLCIGLLSVASGVQSVAIGRKCESIGVQSFTFGYGAKASQQGKIVFGTTIFSATIGQSQYGKIILVAETTTTTAVALTSNGGAASTTNQLILASGQAMAIQGTLIAKQSGSGNMAGWNITGIVSNNAGTMAVSGLALTAIGSDSITLGASPTIAVDNTNKGVTITSGYKSATNIRWVATLNTSEVIYT
jgi:hypothetical protein